MVGGLSKAANMIQRAIERARDKGDITFTVPAGENVLVTCLNVSGNTAQRASMPFTIYEVDPAFILSERNGDSYFAPRWDQ